MMGNVKMDSPSQTYTVVGIAKNDDHSVHADLKDWVEVKRRMHQLRAEQRFREYYVIESYVGFTTVTRYDTEGNVTRISDTFTAAHP